MAEQLGLFAKINFDGSDAIRGMNRTSKAFQQMKQSAKLAGEGIRNVKQGFKGFGVASAAVTAGMVASVKKFADFEGQMGAVKAVLGKDAAPEFERLEGLAMKLGSTTSFTAKESAEAMENLARAGLNANQITSAIAPTLAAAAADGIDLATAATIVTDNMNAFGLQASDATKIADTLAFVSSKTATNMTQLQEGLKFVAPTAAKMGISIEDSAAALGVLADVGLKASLGGTGLKNALLKISKAAKNGVVKVGKFNAKVVETADGGVDLAATMGNIVDKINNIKSPLDKAQASMKLLGLRGMGAEAAFAALGKNSEKAKLLFNDMAKSAKGTAKEMQRVRLDNLHGQLTIMESSIDGFVNSMGKTLKPVAERVISGPGGLTEIFGDAASAFQILVNSSSMGSEEVDKRLKGLNQTVVGFVKGFIEGVEGAKSVLKGFVGVFKVAGTVLQNTLGPLGILGEKGSGAQGLTAMAFKLGAFGLGLKVTTSLVSRLASVTKGSLQIVKGTFGVAGGYLSRFKPFQKIIGKLPGGMGKAAKALGAAEKITAQPVRVVNFDEMGSGFGGTTTPGAGGGATAAGGGFLGQSVGKGMFKGASKLGTVAKTASVGVAVLGAGIAGWQIGKAIDEVTGLSSAFANLNPVVAISKKRVQVHEKLTAASTASRQAQMFAKLASTGTTLKSKEGEVGTEISRELVIQKLKQGALKDATAGEQKAVLSAISETLKKIPTLQELQNRGPLPQDIKIILDGREIAKSVKVNGEESDLRGGKKSKPGSRLDNRSR